MSLNMPSRRACKSISHTLVLRPKPRTIPNFVLTIPQHRSLSVWDYFTKDKKSDKAQPMTVDELMKGYKPAAPEAPKRGALADNSIFGKEEGVEDEQESEETKKGLALARDQGAMAAALDPKPWARARWQRKKVIQSIQHRGRISKTEQLLKQERQHTYSSYHMKTSMKKMVPLARQIAGKTVEDALIQLRFSKKMVAVEIANELKAARDEAIVAAGMGLGHVKPVEAGEDSAEDGLIATGEESSVTIKDKDGRARIVKPSTIYIDQAWVGKGKYGQSIEHRARGQRNLLKHPHTSISFSLKEEKTRIRQAEDRKVKAEKARPWLHHPDRNIPHQRQYIMW